ncbi:MmgE/PrpD family protein [Pigmentiphaga soli]|uniref:MmgE/PrpD family protein n=1 Tax=Pigmentiphaga soli TaxID=1007095 RepID=A0ABP8HEJ7_9BURK
MGAAIDPASGQATARPSAQAPGQTAAQAAQAGIAGQLADRVAALRYGDLPSEAVHWARVGILDTVGAMLAGAREDATALCAAGLDLQPGPALLFGSRRRVSVLDAALVNGTASHVLDFDDCSVTMGGHPSAPLLAALFPLAEQLGSNGRDFVAAYVAGFEVEAKLGLGVNFHHYSKGWHPTSTLGTFGAAAACARLLGLDAGATARALALAASFASGIKANFGTMAKPLHVGHAARNGIYAARLAGLGFTANAASAFEHRQGFLDVFNGPGTYDMEPALAAWGAPWDIVSPGIGIKQYPCCASTHPALDAMLQLVRAHRPAPDDVVRVDAAIHSRRLAHTNRPRPDSPLDCKFSLQYVLARALLSGRVGVGDFDQAAYRDPAVRDLLPRMQVAAYDHATDNDFAQDNHAGATVEIHMRNGEVLRARVEERAGRTAETPLPGELLREKFALCAAVTADPAAAREIADQVDRIECLGDIRELTTLLERAVRDDSERR